MLRCGGLHSSMAFFLPWCGIPSTPHYANVRVRLGIPANPLVLGPLCSMQPVGTPWGAKQHLGAIFSHVGLVGAWGFACTYQAGLVLEVCHMPCVNPLPKMVRKRQPNLK